MSQNRHPDGPLRVTRVRPGLAPEAADAPFAVERLTALTHEMANLLDGALRCQLLARRSLAAIAPEAEVQVAMRHIDTVHGALERMAELVHAAMSGAGAISPAAQHWLRRAVTLREAVNHAVDVLFPEAQQHGIRIDWKVSENAAGMPAGPLYTVILNGLRNAMESIQRAMAQQRPGSAMGLIEIIADAAPMNAAGVVVLHVEIRDDGRGLASAEDGKRALDVGYTTKPGSAGVGLALSREVVREVGGSIELLMRDDRSGARPGAVLKIEYPVVAPGT